MRVWIAVLLSVIMAASACARMETAGMRAAGDTEPGRELICMAADREEAEETAKLYGITLVSYKNGLAAFHTEEDPLAVLERGKANGWKTLSLNIQDKALGR